MDFYEVNQDTNSFELFRKGKAKVLNPRQLTVTILDSKHNDDGKGYSKGKYSCYELAEILINGWQYHKNTPVKRPFMFYLKELIDNNQRHHISPIIKNNMKYDKSQKGWIVDWDAISTQLSRLCEQMLAQDVSPMLTPITAESQSDKSSAGYGDTTLYATGQLFQSVFVYGS